MIILLMMTTKKINKKLIKVLPQLQSDKNLIYLLRILKLEPRVRIMVGTFIRKRKLSNMIRIRCLVQLQYYAVINVIPFSVVLTKEHQTKQSLNTVGEDEEVKQR